LLKTFTVAQTAELEQVSQHTVLSWLKNGSLRGHNAARNPGGMKPRWRITQQDLDEFRTKRATVAAPQHAKRRRKQRTSGVVEFY
jgi:predicted site-specific integrase-resolvase